MHTEGLATNGFRSRDRPANAPDFRFRKAVYRVLIALSFKSFRRRNERYRRRERSDCSEARILPIVEEERPSEPELDAENYIAAASMVRSLVYDRCSGHPRASLPLKCNFVYARHSELRPITVFELPRNYDTVTSPRAGLSERRALARFGCHGDRGAPAYNGVYRLAGSPEVEFP